MPDPDKRLEQLEEQVQAVIAALAEIKKALPPPEPAKDRAAKRWGLLAPVVLLAGWVWQWRRTAALSLAGTATAAMWAIPTPVTDHAEPTFTPTAHHQPSVAVTHSTTGTPSSGRPLPRTLGTSGAGHHPRGRTATAERRTPHPREPSTALTSPPVTPPVTVSGTPAVAPSHVAPSCVPVLRLLCR